MGEIFDRLTPMSPGQEELKKVLENANYEVVGVFGPTGTGKSLFSVLYGIDSVISGRSKRFIISRPVIDVVSGREMTAVDLGEMYYSIAISYLRDILAGFIDWSSVEKLISEGKVVFADTHYLRGRTFDDSVIFLDDAQSIPPESSIEMLMRIGGNSKFIVAGDPVFQKPQAVKDGASVVREVLLGEERARVIDLGLKDIVRPGARRGIKLLLEARMRSRSLSESERNIVDAARARAPDADIVTVAEFIDEKKKFNISSEAAPDALIVTKEGYIGRLIGRKGERIGAIESDTGLKLRAIELTLDLKQLIRAIHPVSWIYKNIVDADFMGPDIAVKVQSSAYGAFVGQRGSYVRFIDSALRKLMGVGVRAIEVPEEVEEKERKRRK
ncbi:MAG: PhoH family protein [Desulfurococcaceae archaeon]